MCENRLARDVFRPSSCAFSDMGGTSICILFAKLVFKSSQYLNSINEEFSWPTWIKYLFAAFVYVLTRKKG